MSKVEAVAGWRINVKHPCPPAGIGIAVVTAPAVVEVAVLSKSIPVPATKVIVAAVVPVAL